MMSWMAYTLIIGSLIATVALLAEQVAWARRWSTRGIWGAAIFLLLLSMFVPALPRAVRVAPVASSVAGENALTHALDASVQSMPSVHASGSLLTEVIRKVHSGMAECGVWMERVNGDSARWNRAFIALWLAASALLALIVASIARRERAFSRGLRARDVDGTQVLVTDSIGPAVLGPTSSAILLPEWALDLDATLLSLVLKHEREHLAARDPLRLAAGLCAVVLVPWHLPLWWSYRRLRLAIEVDCDGRVLRSKPDVKRYAQLLLLVSQRSAYTTRAFSPVLSAATPLRAQEAQLSRRIRAMTQPASARAWGRTIVLVAAAMCAAGVGYALPSPRRSVIVPRYVVPAAGARKLTSPSSQVNHADEARSSGASRLATRKDHANSTSEYALRDQQQARALVHITELGAYGIPSDSTGEKMLNEILVFTTGRARVGIGLGEPVPLTDTLHLKTLPAMTLDVTDGEVQVVLVGAGLMKMAGDVTGGPALHLGATSNHITFMQGGVGVRTR